MVELTAALVVGFLVGWLGRNRYGLWKIKRYWRREQLRHAARRRAEEGIPVSNGNGRNGRTSLTNGWAHPSNPPPGDEGKDRNRS